VCGSTKKAYEREAPLAIGSKIVETGVTQKRKGLGSLWSLVQIQSVPLLA